MDKTEYANLDEARKAYFKGEITAEEYSKYVRLFSLGNDENTRNQPIGLTDTMSWY